jgi:hypothetical protein
MRSVLFNERNLRSMRYKGNRITRKECGRAAEKCL